MTPLLSDSVPLFLLHEEPLLLYIIDNDLFQCFSPHHWCYYGVKDLHLLSSLFSSSTSHLLAVPDKFHEFFQQHSFSTIPDEIFDFIIGGKGFFGFPSLDFQLQHRNENGVSDVLLHSFQLDDQSLPFEVSLSHKDAFFILANHTINAGRGFMHYDSAANTVSFWYPPQKASSTFPAASWEKNKQAKAQDPRTLFRLLYANYILDQLSTDSFSLPYLLSRNGAGILSLLHEHPRVQDYIKQLLVSALDLSSLSLIQQVQLFAAIKLNDFDGWFIEDPSAEIELFFTNKKDIIRTIITNISNHLPNGKSFFF